MSIPEPGSPERQAVTRRTWLKAMTVGALGCAAGAATTAAVVRAMKSPAPRFRVLTEAEAALLTDICEQLVPRDDAPGAADAGVVHFIDRQLAGRLARHAGTYRRGLDAFRRTCLGAHQRPFAELTTAEKIALLRRIETGGVEAALWRDPASPQFFRLVLAHTLQGFYGPPRHGGNRNYVSYRMLGVDYPQIIGQNRYRAPRA